MKCKKKGNDEKESLSNHSKHQHYNERRHYSSVVNQNTGKQSDMSIDDWFFEVTGGLIPLFHNEDDVVLRKLLKQKLRKLGRRRRYGLSVRLSASGQIAHPARLGNDVSLRPLTATQPSPEPPGWPIYGRAAGGRGSALTVALPDRAAASGPNAAVPTHSAARRA